MSDSLYCTRPSWHGVHAAMPYRPICEYHWSLAGRRAALSCNSSLRHPRRVTLSCFAVHCIVLVRQASDDSLESGAPVMQGGDPMIHRKHSARIYVILQHVESLTQSHMSAFMQLLACWPIRPSRAFQCTDRAPPWVAICTLQPVFCQHSTISSLCCTVIGYEGCSLLVHHFSFPPFSYHKRLLMSLYDNWHTPCTALISR